MIGKMDKRITFQEDQGTSLSTYGEKTVSWVDIYTCWANIRPLAGAELYQSKQVWNDVVGKINMRYYAVKPEWRVKFGTRIFKIIAIIQHNEEGRWTEIRYSEDV